MLPTKMKLIQKQIDIDVTCIYCELEKDDCHVFAHCFRAQDCWIQLGLYVRNTTFSSCAEFF